MKLQYTALGSEALRRFRESASNANKIQRELIFSLLEKNKDTAYGRKYDFAGIHSPLEYQRKVPLTDYEDYDAYIQEMLAGQKAVLTAEPPIYYCISSGSTGGPKYLPVSEADLWLSCYDVYGTLFGMIQEYDSDKTEEELFGKILQTGEFIKTETDGGVMKGIRSSAFYQWLDQENGLDISNYTAPREVLFPSGLMDLTYAKARFALAEPDVTAIHSVFIHHVTGFMQYIENNWDLLLNDMERGRMDERIPLGGEWRSRLERWLPPNPERAAQLRELSRETLADHMIQKLWKNTRYIMAIGGSSMERYADLYSRYAAGIPTQHFVYGSSEGMMAVANGVENPDSYILLPRAGFFEFLPENNSADTESDRPLFCHEVQTGKTYELVYTNLSGLYRYRMKDVVRIEGFYGEAPIIRFCYRKNQLLNIADEKTNTEQLECAVAELEQKTGLHITGYCVQEDFSVMPGRYLTYLECSERGGRDLSQEFEECLRRANYGYDGCRSMRQIGCAKLAYLKQGAFARYKQMLAGKGYEMGQNKPIRVLAEEESRQFFLREIEGCETEETGEN